MFIVWCWRGGTGGEQGSKSQELLKGPKGSHSALVPGKYLLAASFFSASSPPTKIDQVPAGRVLQVGSITRLDVVFCFITFCHVRVVEPQVGRRSYSTASLFYFLPPLTGVAGSGGLGVLLTRSQKFVLPRDRYLGPLCCACHHRRRL